MTNQELLAELEARFPGIADPDEEMDGGDTVDAVCEWYHQIKATAPSRFVKTCPRAKYWPINAPTDEETDMERGRR